MTGATAQEAVAVLISPQADDLWSGLTADGYVVDVRRDGSAVTVAVRAGEGACADCLVPRAVLHEIVLGFLRQNAIPTDELDVVIDTPAGH